MLMKKILPDNSNLPPFGKIVLLAGRESILKNTSPGIVQERWIISVGELISITKDGPNWNISGIHTKKTSTSDNIVNMFSNFDFDSLFNKFSSDFTPTHYMDLTDLKFEL